MPSPDEHSRDGPCLLPPDDAGKEEDRDLTQGLPFPHPGDDLRTFHIGKDGVHENEVRGTIRDPVEGLAPAPGSFDGESLGGQGLHDPAATSSSSSTTTIRFPLSIMPPPPKEG